MAFLPIAIFVLVANAGIVGRFLTCALRLGGMRAVSELNLLNNVEHWRGRAADARRLAEQAADGSRDALLDIAVKYDRIAQRVGGLAEGAMRPI